MVEHVLGQEKKPEMATEKQKKAWLVLKNNGYSNEKIAIIAQVPLEMVIGALVQEPKMATEKQKNDWLTLKNEGGFSIERIADMFAVPPKTVERVLGQEKKTNIATEEQKSDWLDLKNRGYSNELIAYIFEVPLEMVEHVLGQEKKPKMATKEQK